MVIFFSMEILFKNIHSKDQREGEVLVRLSVGEIVGHSLTIPNLPWTPNQDPNEQIPFDRFHPEPNPLPSRNNVTIFTFVIGKYSLKFQLFFANILVRNTVC